MGTSDKAKGKGDPHTLPTIRTTGILHSGAYPNEIVEGRDTDPMALDLGAFDESEDTRAEPPSFQPDVTEKHLAPTSREDDDDATAHGVPDHDEPPRASKRKAAPVKPAR